MRLKGGDPFVFGRGGEEALMLREAGVPFEIVPGMTAGLAAPAYAGIPVTHRGLSTAVALVTGHTREGEGEEPALDWRALAAFPGTLVFYMGVSALPAIAAGLIDAGRPRRGACGRDRSRHAPRAEDGQRDARDDRAGRNRGAAVRPPSVTVIGAVAALSEELSWLPRRPLAGRTVAVTRARAQASGLARSLAQLGARVVQAPAIAVLPLPGPALDPIAL